VLGDLPTSPALERHLAGPRGHVCLRVIDEDAVFQRLAVGMSDAFNDMERIAVWTPQAIEPRPVVEADGVDDERVAFSTAGRVAEPFVRAGVLQ
jgi:hypothetical protein